MEVEGLGVSTELFRLSFKGRWVDYITLCKQVYQPSDTCCRALAFGTNPPAELPAPLEGGHLSLGSDFSSTPAVGCLRFSEEADHSELLACSSGIIDLLLQLHC